MQTANPEITRVSLRGVWELEQRRARPRALDRGGPLRRRSARHGM